MTAETVRHIFALAFLGSVILVFLIDAGSELNVKFALSYKWSIGWYLARYTAIICGMLLSLDVLT